ncbi:Duodenase-1 precursor [Salmo salar]|uniref:Granzyme M n=1 Tax=Salmo salar TaxID=8030 RepID=B5XGY9_SALSA|nr:Duodenase-1 precursor [Salmo salar]ACI70109.1 Duodenase-1 precursor [Salmo salar]|eukprot:NP_001135073.1 Duodenase-1 precursor [Salmo salar]
MHTINKLLLTVLLTYLGHSVAFGGQIINGKKAKRNSLQYMASVQNNEKHICGGFLITPDFVLTAAHCNKSNLSVVLGTHNIKMGLGKAVRYNVERKCKSNSYENVKDGSDIMLLKLSRKVKLSKSVKKVRLPTKDKVLKPNTKCLAAGWGTTTTDRPFVDELQVVDVEAIDLKVCQKQWDHVDFNLPPNVICAGGYPTNKGTCQGDSGGPLVCNGEAVGIVSFNMNGNCAYPNVPNVYTQISKYLPWIKEVINKQSC